MSITMKYKQDGVDHINVYSNAATQLGRLLSNFAHTPFSAINSDGEIITFQSVEGWWHWYCTGKRYNHLMDLYGFAAKKEGRKYEQVYVPTKEVLSAVYQHKVACNPGIRNMLIQSCLPFTHYYVFGNKVVETKWEWTGSLWNEIRTAVKLYLIQEEI